MQYVYWLAKNNSQSLQSHPQTLVRGLFFLLVNTLSQYVFPSGDGWSISICDISESCDEGEYRLIRERVSKATRSEYVFFTTGRQLAFAVRLLNNRHTSR